MTEYYLFGTEGCHLCDQAEQLVEGLSSSITYKKKDIIENEDWSQRFAVRIPVLYHLNSQQELGWPFDENMLQQFIDKHD